MAGYDKPKTADTGVTKRRPFNATKHARRTLAEQLEHDYPVAYISWWLGEVAAGRDPESRRDEDGKPLSGASDPVPWPIRVSAMRMLLDRQNGRAAQHIEIKNETRVSIGGPPSVSSAAIRAMDPGKRSAARTLLRELLSGAAAITEAPPVSAADQSEAERAVEAKDANAV